MPRHRCPKCGHFRSWELRRGARRCRECRKEWTPPRFTVPGVRASAREWRAFLKCFLRYRTAKAVRGHFPRSHTLVLKMCRAAREAMARDVPGPFSGTVEMDETCVAGSWYNKRWAQRKAGTKRGRGTGKQPVFGIYERERKLVRTWLVGDVKKRTLMPIIKAHVVPGSTIYSDGYQLYAQSVREGYFHDSVDHAAGEYARGGVSTNAMEGFWGMPKRRLRATGGIRRERLYLYVSEEAWRYNNRALPESEKIRKLSRLLGEFGGRIAT